MPLKGQLSMEYYWFLFSRAAVTNNEATGHMWLFNFVAFLKFLKLNIALFQNNLKMIFVLQLKEDTSRYIYFWLNIKIPKYKAIFLATGTNPTKKFSL